MVPGYSERDGGSLYRAQSTISPDGVIVMHRRKIKPTHVERTIWGEGQASSLRSVVDTPFEKIGALCCFEHYQPLLRYCQYGQGVQIRVAAWPLFFEVEKGSVATFQGSSTAGLLASRFMGIEGQAFVIVCTQVVKEENLVEMGVTDKVSSLVV